MKKEGKKKRDGRLLLSDWAKKNGWELDRYGHYKKDINGEIYRLKNQANKVRYEVKTKAGWVRLQSGLYTKLYIMEDGKLGGLKVGY